MTNNTALRNNETPTRPSMSSSMRCNTDAGDTNAITNLAAISASSYTVADTTVSIPVNGAGTEYCDMHTNKTTSVQMVRHI